MNTHTREEIKGKMRDLFTIEDLETIANMLQNGHIEHVAAVVDVADQEHEFWLGEYMKLYRPEEVVVDSVVEKEILELQKTGQEIDTPEKEKFWEDRLKLEREGKPLPNLEKALEELEVSPKETEPVSEEKTAEGAYTRKQLMAKLETLGVAFKGTEKREVLVSMLEEALKTVIPQDAEVKSNSSPQSEEKTAE